MLWRGRGIEHRPSPASCTRPLSSTSLAMPLWPRLGTSAQALLWFPTVPADSRRFVEINLNLAGFRSMVASALPHLVLIARLRPSGLLLRSLI